MKHDGASRARAVQARALDGRTATLLLRLDEQRPMRSEAPVKSWPSAPRRRDRWPRATRSARATCRAAAKKSGNRPHAMPSFRLLTRPAWLTRREVRDPRSDVRRKTSRCDGRRAWPAARVALRLVPSVCRASRAREAPRARARPRRTRRRDRTAAAAGRTRRDVSGRERAQRDGEVAGELVEAHREAAPFRADEVDLHDDRRRPGEPLADAEEHVREEHPGPRRRPHQEERHRAARRAIRRRGRACGPTGRRAGRRGSWSAPWRRRTRR